MSSSSPAARTTPARSRVSPWLDGAALRRARLTVVPRVRVRASRFPFVTLVSAILLAGVVGLLCFNTSMQQAAFVESRLSAQATDLAARQQTLEMELQELRDPQHLAAQAQKQGLVIPTTIAMLQVPSGKVSGEPAPTTADSTPPLWPRVRMPVFQ